MPPRAVMGEEKRTGLADPAKERPCFWRENFEDWRKRSARVCSECERRRVGGVGFDEDERRKCPLAGERRAVGVVCPLWTNALMEGCVPKPGGVAGRRWTKSRHT